MKADDRIVTAIRLPKPLAKRLRIAAVFKDSTLNEILVRAAEEYLEREGVEVVEKRV